MERIYNNWLKIECFVKRTEKEAIGNDLKYWLVDSDGNTIWNGQYRWWSACSVSSL